VLRVFSGQVMQWRSTVEDVYYITHSSTYGDALNALNAIKPYASGLADALSSPALAWMNLGWLAGSMRLVSSASYSMQQAYSSSEAAYNAVRAFDALPQYLLFIMSFGLILIMGGGILVALARREKK